MYVVVCISAGSRNPMSPPAGQLILSTTYGTVQPSGPGSRARADSRHESPTWWVRARTHPGHRPHATKRHIASSTMLPAAVAGSPRPR